MTNNNSDNINAEKILDKFQDVKLIREGGQKLVFLGIHDNFGKSALKVGRVHSYTSLKRIEREVNVLKAIKSPYYPKIHEFKVIDELDFYIIEEFIEGEPLSQCLDRFFTPEDAVQLISDLVEGLNVLWERRIVHRDVKPDNILIRPDSTPKIIDLGIARVLEEESLTATLASRGPATLIYASPEQLANRKKFINHRSDQFNLGIILVQLLLEGRHPFDPNLVGSGESIMENILVGNWYYQILTKANYSIFEPLLGRLLGNEPYKRYRTADLLLRDLNRVVEGLG